jgi:transaldolase
MNIKIYSDGADLSDIKESLKDGIVSGFTTNPTLMKKAGVVDYLDFAEKALKITDPLPLSLEVFSDDFVEMKRQALILNNLGKNIFVKIPITNSFGESSIPLIKELDGIGVKLNITAILTLDRVKSLLNNIEKNNSHIISVFAGRIADTGRDPLPAMKESLSLIKDGGHQSKLLWASTREAFNIYQANGMGCDIITASPAILKKLSLQQTSLTSLSLDTVKMFSADAAASGFKL